MIVASLLFVSCSGNGADAPIGPATAPSATPVPQARTEVAAARLGDQILVIGGLLADGSPTDRVDRYDLKTGRWSDGPAMPAPLHHAGAAEFGGRLFVAGGYVVGPTSAWSETDQVWSLGPDDGTWKAEPSLGHRRGALGLAATTSRLVAFGGTSDGQVVDTVEVYRAGTDGWRPAPPMSMAREHTAAATAGGRVYAIAGRSGGIDTNVVAVESFDPAAFNGGWRKEPALAVPRGGIAAATVGDTICVAGGEEPTGTIASVECLLDGAWRAVGDLAEPRHGLGVVAGDDGRIHVLAGGPQPGLFVSIAHEILQILEVTAEN